MNKSRQHLNRYLKIRIFVSLLFFIIVSDGKSQSNNRVFVSSNSHRKIILNLNSKRFEYNYKKGLTYRNSKGNIEKINNQMYLLKSDIKEKYLKCNYDSSITKNDNISLTFLGISKEDREYHNCGILINNSLLIDCRCDSLKSVKYENEIKNIQFYIRGNARTFTRIADTLFTKIQYPILFVKNFNVKYNDELFNYEIIKDTILIKRRKLIFRGKSLKQKNI